MAACYGQLAVTEYLAKHWPELVHTRPEVDSLHVEVAGGGTCETFGHSSPTLSLLGRKGHRY